METIQSRNNVAKNLLLPDNKLVLPFGNLSVDKLLVGLGGSWIGTQCSNESEPRYKFGDKPDFRLISLDSNVVPTKQFSTINGVDVVFFISNLDMN